MTKPTAAREILKARAKSLAQRHDDGATRRDDISLIEFRVAGERYAIEYPFIREVVILKELTPVPCTPAFISGIMNLRGQILPLIDIKKFFDLPESGINDLHVVIVVSHGDVDLGILADSIVGVRGIPADAVQPSLPTLTGIRAKYLKGVTSDHLALLDVTKILGDPKIVVNEEVIGNGEGSA